MRSLILLLLCICLGGGWLHGQAPLSVSTGLAFDVNNQGRFQHIPLSIQWMTTEHRRTNFLVKLDLNLPFSKRGLDSAFTTQVGQTPGIQVEKSIVNTIASVGIGLRYMITNQDENTLFLDIIPVGYMSQRIRVQYVDYNPNLYEVRDPDINQRYSGFFASAGLTYQRNRWLFQLHIQTSPLDLVNDLKEYKNSFAQAALFQIMVGKTFSLSKKSKR